MTALNPIDAFFKYAKTTRVRAHVRHEADGDTVPVQEYLREVTDTGAAAPAPAQAESVFRQDTDAGPDSTADVFDAEDLADESETLVREEGAVGDAPKFTVEETERAQALISRKADELELWRKWKDGGQKPADVAPLLKSFRPMIQHHLGKYKGRVKLIPDSVLEAEYNIQFVNALKTYDPKLGALGTYVFRYLEKAKRFIGENQNVGRIPENRIYKIKEFQKARDSLADDLGRLPDQKDLAKRLKWSVAEVARMESEQRKDLLAEAFAHDPYEWVPSRAEEALRLFKYELAGNERVVYEYLTGYGRPRLASTGDIAKHMGLQDYQVSRIKDGLQRKLARHVRE